MQLFSPIDICSKALLKVGANSISSFEEASSEAELAAQFYDMTKLALLAGYPWSFATTSSRLARLAKPAMFGYGLSYALPHDLLRIISASSSGSPRGGVDYKICARTLYANGQDIMLTYIFAADEGVFPAYFASCLVAKLAAEFSVAFFDSAGKSAFLQNAAEGEYRRAKLVDAQGAMPKYISSSPLIDARG
jgi:hypothetical protein